MGEGGRRDHRRARVLAGEPRLGWYLQPQNSLTRDPPGAPVLCSVRPLMSVTREGAGDSEAVPAGVGGTGVAPVAAARRVGDSLRDAAPACRCWASRKGLAFMCCMTAPASRVAYSEAPVAWRWRDGAWEAGIKSRQNRAEAAERPGVAPPPPARPPCGAASQFVLHMLVRMGGAAPAGGPRCVHRPGRDGARATLGLPRPHLTCPLAMAGAGTAAAGGVGEPRVVRAWRAVAACKLPAALCLQFQR